MEFEPKTQTEAGGVPPRRTIVIGGGLFAGGDDVPPAFREAFSGDGDWCPQPTSSELAAMTSNGLNELLNKETTGQRQPDVIVPLVEKYVIPEVFEPASDEQVSSERKRGFIKRARPPAKPVQ